jgi:hypothetical protein
LFSDYGHSEWKSSGASLILLNSRPAVTTLPPEGQLIKESMTEVVARIRLLVTYASSTTRVFFVRSEGGTPDALPLRI